MKICIDIDFNSTIDFISIFHCKGLTTCSGSKARKASELYKQYYKISDDACPQPCHNVIFYIGYPVIHKRIIKTHLGLSRIYFKKIVKVSEDFVSYDLLRYQDSNEIKWYVIFLSQHGGRDRRLLRIARWVLTDGYCHNF